MKLKVDYELPQGIEEFMLTNLICSIFNCMFVFLSVVVNGCLYIVRTLFLFLLAGVTLILDILVGAFLRFTGLLK